MSRSRLEPRPPRRTSVHACLDNLLFLLWRVDFGSLAHPAGLVARLRELALELEAAVNRLELSGEASNDDVIEAVIVVVVANCLETATVALLEAASLQPWRLSWGTTIARRATVGGPRALTCHDATSQRADRKRDATHTSLGSSRSTGARKSVPWAEPVAGRDQQGRNRGGLSV